MPVGVVVDHRSAMGVVELPEPLRRVLMVEFAGLGPAANPNRSLPEWSNVQARVTAIFDKPG